jgi:SAM-dependent methyltransferase
MTQNDYFRHMESIEIGGQVWFTMLAGMKLDVFTPLDDGPLTTAELADALGVDAGKLDPVLYGLVVAGLLTVEDGRFANTEDSSTYLVRGKPEYRGGGYPLWEELAASALKTADMVRTGKPQAKHDFATMTEDDLYVFLGSLHGGNLGAGRMLAARYDFSGCTDLLDVGGGSGGVSISLASEHPHLRAAVVDFPSVAPVTHRFISEAGIDDRVEVVAADVAREAPPVACDVAVMRHFLQVLSATDAQAALRNVWQAMRPGGTLYIIGVILDDTRLSPTIPVLYNIQCINFYDSGQAYTEGEYRAWLAEAGFVDVTREEDMGYLRVLAARKPGA